MKKQFTIVCNWKMYFSYPLAGQWIREHLQQLPLNSNITYVICPSFDALASCADQLKKSSVLLGGQNCSAYASGAYTGQISAQSLEHIGCSYCIIGHSEVRAYESNEIIAAKAEQLFRHNISPIICVGEDEVAYRNKTSFDIINRQLIPVRDRVQMMQTQDNPLCIAYEPQWAIGTGRVPSTQELTAMFEHISSIFKDHANVLVRLLYGGSVNERTALNIYNIELIQGFLIGKASTNFQELKNIVNLIC